MSLLLPFMVDNAISVFMGLNGEWVNVDLLLVAQGRKNTL